MQAHTQPCVLAVVPLLATYELVKINYSTHEYIRVVNIGVFRAPVLCCNFGYRICAPETLPSGLALSRCHDVSALPYKHICPWSAAVPTLSGMWTPYQAAPMQEPHDSYMK